MAFINRLWVGNPSGSQTKTAFTSEQITIQATPRMVFLGHPMVIDEISIRDIFVGIELYDTAGQTSNWSKILSQQEGREKGKRGYLIRKLVIENLNVELTQSNGKSKRFPTIDQMVFYNISDETGFPIEEIEKAIFKMVMMDIFKKFGLDQLKQTLAPIKSAIKTIPFF